MRPGDLRVAVESPSPPDGSLPRPVADRELEVVARGADRPLPGRRPGRSRPGRRALGPRNAEEELVIEVWTTLIGIREMTWVRSLNASSTSPRSSLRTAT